MGLQKGGVKKGVLLKEYSAILKEYSVISGSWGPGTPGFRVFGVIMLKTGKYRYYFNVKT